MYNKPVIVIVQLMLSVSLHCSWKFVTHKKYLHEIEKVIVELEKKLKICCRKNIFYFSRSLNHKCVIHNKINKGEKEIVKRYSRTSLCQKQLWGKILNLNVHKRNFLKQANRRPTVLLNPSTCVRVSFALSPELEKQLHRVLTSPPVPPKNSREGIRFDAIHQNRFYAINPNSSFVYFISIAFASTAHMMIN